MSNHAGNHNQNQSQNQTDFKTMNEMLGKAHNAAIVGHIYPDGDCIGSCIALRSALKHMGKKADIFIDDEVPENFLYLPSYQKINRLPDVLGSYDLLIIVDSSSEDRIGACGALRERSKKVLVVDHHLNSAIKADEMVINTARASVGEILFEFFAAYGYEITKDMATALYTSVATDTGCFMHSNTTSYSHFVASELIKKGINLEAINYNNFKLYDRKIIPGFAYVLKNMRFEYSGQICFVCLPYNIMRKYDLAGETHKFKKYASEASGVKIGVMLTEKTKGEFHVSLRSNGNINVGKAAEHFSGGGHKNAAGFTMKGTYKEAVKEILPTLIELLEKHRHESHHESGAVVVGSDTVHGGNSGQA